MLVDDHPLFRMGLKTLLEAEEGYSVVSENETPVQAWQAFQHTVIDLVICDLSFQESSGLGLVREIRRSGSKCPILILSMHDEHFWAERVLKEGVNGYLMKDQSAGSVINATRSILNGGIFISETVQQKILRQLTGLSSEETSLEDLSVREYEIFLCIAKGMSTPEIASSLFISVKTVQTHQGNIRKKLNLKSLSELRSLSTMYLDSENGV